MEKTIKSLLLLMIITGTVFSGCASGIGSQRPEDEAATDEMSIQVETTNGDVVEVQTETKAKPEVKKDVQAEIQRDVQPQANSSAYADGTYTRLGAYQSPAGEDGLMVSVVVENGVVKDMALEGRSASGESMAYINLFISGVKGMVVGKKLDEVGAIGAVNGSSLTGIGFNKAMAEIKASAKK